MPCHVAFKILVPGPGTEPRAMTVNAQSPNHWTCRELPSLITLLSMEIFMSKNVLLLLF